MKPVERVLFRFVLPAVALATALLVSVSVGQFVSRIGFPRTTGAVLYIVILFLPGSVSLAFGHRLAAERWHESLSAGVAGVNAVPVGLSPAEPPVPATPPIRPRATPPPTTRP